MMNTNGSKSRSVLAGLALAALGSAGAYGITATGADLAPTTQDEQARDPQSDGEYLWTLELAPDFKVRGITFNALD